MATQGQTVRKPLLLQAAWRLAYANRRRAATAMAAVIAAGLGYHVVFGRNGLTAYQHKRQNSAALERELGALSRENEALRAHVDRLKNDPTSIEHQAREELHYARPGEVIYTVPYSPDAVSH